MNTNGFFVSISTNSIDINSTKIRLIELINRNSIRGTNVTYTSLMKNGNDLTINSTVSTSYSEELSNKLGTSFQDRTCIFGFSTNNIITGNPEKNVSIYSNSYSAAIDGYLSNKEDLCKKFGISNQANDVTVVLKLYSIFKQTSDDYLEAIRKLYANLEGEFSIGIIDAVVSKCIFFTNKSLYVRYDVNNTCISSEIPTNDSIRWTKLKIGDAYAFNINNSGYVIIKLNIDKYRQKFDINRAVIYFDGSIESATSIYVAANVLNTKELLVLFDKRSNLSENFIKKTFDTIDFTIKPIDGDLIDTLSFIAKSGYDTFIDSLNVDSSRRSFSDIHFYEDLFDTYTKGTVKYIDLFKYLSLKDIVSIGDYFNVPYESVIHCEKPLLYNSINVNSDEINKDNTELYVRCGSCDTCLRNKRAFYLAGVNDPGSNLYYDNNKVMIDVPFTEHHLNQKEFYEKYYSKIISSIEL